MPRKKKIPLSNNALSKIYLVLAVVGILFLFILTYFVKPQEISICKIRELQQGDYVKVYGKIISERNLTSDFTILTLQNSTCRVEITCNCKNFTNQNVSVIGKIEYYQNKTQISADKIQQQ